MAVSLSLLVYIDHFFNKNSIVLLEIQKKKPKNSQSTEYIMKQDNKISKVNNEQLVGLFLYIYFIIYFYDTNKSSCNWFKFK